MKKIECAYCLFPANVLADWPHMLCVSCKSFADKIRVKESFRRSAEITRHHNQDDQL